MQISSGLSKNVIILTIVLFALIAALGVMLKLSQDPAYSPAPALKGVTSAAINTNVNELNSLNADLALFAEDNIILDELDAVLSEVGEIENESADLTVDEKNLNDLAQDLDNSSSDELINQEIDQALQEAAL